MAERIEAPEPEGGSEAGPEPISPSAAMAIGVRKGRAARARPDPEFDAFLRKQSRLIDIQTEHLHEQRELILSRLRWGRFNDRLRALLQTMTVLVGLAVVIAIAAMAWDAHEDNGLVVDAFSVPADLAGDGLNGEVVATRFLDRLQAMQAATANSDRPAKSFQNNWSSEIKVEIPQTGLTFGEFEKLLEEKLGHVSHVSGEVLKTPGGIALTARIGDAPPQTFVGPEASFDDLAQKAAEAVYRTSQPYRYTEYLERRGRLDEAFQVIADLAATGQSTERGWAYAKWGQLDLNYHGDVPSAEAHGSRGLGYGPGSDVQSRITLVNSAVWSGHDEANLRLSRILDVEDQKRLPDTSDLFYLENKLLGRAWLQFSEADYRSSADTWLRTGRQDSSGDFDVFAPVMAATAFALDHDLGAARRNAAVLVGKGEASVMWQVAQGAFQALPVYWIAAESDDWPAALNDARGVDAWLSANRAQRPIYALMQRVWIWPLEALAMSRAGDVAGAEALVNQTPLDCYLCLRVRGQTAATGRDWPTAERWFAEAARQAPSVPLAYSEWGDERLGKGDLAGAIVEYQIAHRKGPRFADPLKGWGDALARQGKWSDALAKYDEALEYAPAWLRLHQARDAAAQHAA